MIRPKICMPLFSGLINGRSRKYTKPLNSTMNFTSEPSIQSGIWLDPDVSQCRDMPLDVNSLCQCREGRRGRLAGRRDQAERCGDALPCLIVRSPLAQGFKSVGMRPPTRSY